MRIVDRYIVATILASSGLVLAALVAMYALVWFVNELSMVGRNHYGLVQAASYILHLVPRFIYELLPISALIGAMVGLGILANRGELTAIRAAGVSVNRIIWAVLKAGLLIVVVLLLIGELVAPPSEELGRRERAKALANDLTLSTSNGFWVRNGANLINAGRVLADGSLQDVVIYQLDSDRRIRMLTAAERAEQVGSSWQLYVVRQTELHATHTEVHNFTDLDWPDLMTPGLTAMVAMEPEMLAAWDLWSYVGYLQANGLESERYRVAFWLRVGAPLTVIVLLLIAPPFIFGSLRSTPVGQRILLGVTIGIGFTILSRTVSHLGQVYDLAPVVSALSPTLTVMVVALVVLRRVV